MSLLLVFSSSSNSLPQISQDTWKKRSDTSNPPRALGLSKPAERIVGDVHEFWGENQGRKGEFLLMLRFVTPSDATLS